MPQLSLCQWILQNCQVDFAFSRRWCGRIFRFVLDSNRAQSCPFISPHQPIHQNNPNETNSDERSIVGIYAEVSRFQLSIWFRRIHYNIKWWFSIRWCSPRTHACATLANGPTKKKLLYYYPRTHLSYGVCEWLIVYTRPNARDPAAKNGYDGARCQLKIEIHTTQLNERNELSKRWKIIIS